MFQIGRIWREKFCTSTFDADWVSKQYVVKDIKLIQVSLFY